MGKTNGDLTAKLGFAGLGEARADLGGGLSRGTSL